MQKPEINAFYKNYAGTIFKVTSIDENIPIATIFWINDNYSQKWDYLRFPDCLKQKLTDLEVELL